MTGQTIGHCIRKHAQKNIRRHKPAYKQLDAKMNWSPWEIYNQQTVPVTWRCLPRVSAPRTFLENIWIINFLEPRKHHDSHLATNIYQLVMTLSDVDWWPTTQDVRPENPFLQFVIVLIAYSGLCHVQTGITSSEGIAYQMTVDVTFPSQMTETVSAEEMLNAVRCLMERDSWGAPKIMMWNRIGLSYKLGPIIFQNICQRQCKCNWGMAALYIYQVLTPNAIHFLHVVGTTLYSMSKSKSQDRFYSAYQHKCYAVVCSQSVFKPDWTLWDEIKDDLMKSNLC